MGKETEDLFRAIARNKAAGLPFNEVVDNHRRLVGQLQDAIEKQRLDLEAAAFGGVTVENIPDPSRAVREAIKANDAQGLKAAALAAYQREIYIAVRLAGEFDQDIAALVDHLRTYGDLANLNQRLFMRFALAEPERRPA